jgi:putative transposase
LRTTNPIESTFATVRHRTIRSKGCLSNKTALAMVFKLLEAAQRRLRASDWVLVRRQRRDRHLRSS